VAANNHYLGTPTRLVIAYSGHLIHFPYDPSTNLTMLQTIPGVQCYYAFCAQVTSSTPCPPCPTLYYAQALWAYTACMHSSANILTNNLLTPNNPLDPPEFIATANLIDTQQDLLCAHHNFLAMSVFATSRTGLVTVNMISTISCKLLGTNMFSLPIQTRSETIAPLFDRRTCQSGFSSQ